MQADHIVCLTIMHERERAMHVPAATPMCMHGSCPDGGNNEITLEHACGAYTVRICKAAERNLDVHDDGCSVHTTS